MPQIPNSRTAPSSGVFSAVFQFALLLNVVALPAVAGFIRETASPDTYTVSAGGQFTVTGSITFSGAITYTYGPLEEILEGLSTDAPLLGLVAGSVDTTQYYPAGLGYPAWAESFSSGGWLGPTTIVGPTDTGITNWRTFTVPVGTPAGLYQYIYGIFYSGDSNGFGQLSSLTLVVPSTTVAAAAPEPSAITLTWPCLLAIAAYGRRRSRAGRS